MKPELNVSEHEEQLQRAFEEARRREAESRRRDRTQDWVSLGAGAFLLVMGLGEHGGSTWLFGLCFVAFSLAGFWREGRALKSIAFALGIAAAVAGVLRDYHVL
ncbi:MAG TPA: hypothetical protein VMB50_03710 [Myxococcales bacterium]|nr:hypothetical protein [Myxococcales bacterium]